MENLTHSSILTISAVLFSLPFLLSSNLQQGYTTEILWHAENHIATSTTYF